MKISAIRKWRHNQQADLCEPSDTKRMQLEQTRAAQFKQSTNFEQTSYSADTRYSRPVVYFIDLHPQFGVMLQNGKANQYNILRLVLNSS